MKTGRFFVYGAALLLCLLPRISRAQLSEQSENCLGCHNDPSSEMTLPDKGTMSVYVNPEEFAASVHGNKLNCTDCHTDISDYPHPEQNLKNRRAYSLALYESCKRCHFANYTKTLEGIHYRLLAKGDTRVPVCVDCHGAHNISKPDLPRVKISQTCKTCHEKIFQTYIQSVHGAALTKGNPDVPACTDCHRAHDIQDPKSKSFIAGTPQLCGSCHGNEKLMKKYGISTSVLQSYLQDFHGVTVTFYSKQKGDVTSWKAVCTDCHGVHDIAVVNTANAAKLKANLANNCKKCHAGASENFPDAWLSHYEPSPQQASLVYFIKLFYKFFIPFTIGGLVLHIFLHVWRVATNR
jgi:predicted CXXCH cytochrome family protein